MRLSVLASATIAVAVAWTGTAQAASLQEAVDKAVSSIPAIGSAQARRQASEERVRVERGALFPTVNIRGESGLQYSDSPGTRRRASRGNDDVRRRQLRLPEPGVARAARVRVPGDRLHLHLLLSLPKAGVQPCLPVCALEGERPGDTCG